MANDRLVVDSLPGPGSRGWRPGWGPGAEGGGAGCQLPAACFSAPLPNMPPSMPSASLPTTRTELRLWRWEVSGPLGAGVDMGGALLL